MAVSYNNLITKNFHGRFGDIVLRRMGDKTVMSKRPNCSKVVKSKVQKHNQRRFAAAVTYAKKVKKDPNLLEYYGKKKRKSQSIWNAAISDFMKKPRVEKVNLSDYQGLPGNVIGISIWDRFKVESVNVVIMNEMGQTIESGMASSKEYSGEIEWEYRLTTENPSYKTSRVFITVKDRPGNIVKETWFVSRT